MTFVQAISPEYIVIVVLLGVAVFTDFRSRRIPNALTFGGMGLGLVFQLLDGRVLAGLAGLGVAFAVGFVLWRLGGAMRAGDAKLLMAVGAITGPFEVIRIFLFTFLINIPVALVQLAVAGRLRSFFGVLRAGITRDREGPRPLEAPFALIIALGVLAARIFPDVFALG